MQPHPRTRPILRRSLVLFISLSACTSWHVETIPPAQLLAKSQPSKVRVKVSDGQRIVLTAPALSGDSLVGKRGGLATGVPLMNVTEIAVRRANTWKTLGLIGGILAAPFAAIGLACALGADCDFSIN